MKLVLACAGFFLCASLPAQGSMTTPPGGLAEEGAEHAILFGTWSEMRIQHADDNHSNGKVRTITEIAFRMDYRSHSSKTAMGRTWTRISLDMSEPANYDSMSSVFAANIGPSPTRVFDNKWSWPTRDGLPLLKPDVWGGAKGQLRFPFAMPWRYAGKGSILADYVFLGGTLENNGAWNTKDKGPFYLLDGEVDHTETRSTSEQLPAVLSRCNDSAIASTMGAYVHGFADVYGKMSANTSLRNMVVFQHASYHTAPGALVLHAVGTGGYQDGVDIGAGCNRLYVDFTRPAILLSFKAQAPDGYSGLARWQLPWREHFANLDIWLQGAWTDSRSGKFMLTAATVVTLPNGLPPRYRTVFQAGANPTTGLGPQTTGLYFPFTRYLTR